MAKITSNISTFGTHDAYMVLHEPDIYEGWIEILEKQCATTSQQQPNISIFQCLQGLADEDVKIIKGELLEDKIVLVKQANQHNTIDITARAKEIKQTKVFKRS